MVKHICIFKTIFLDASVLILEKFHLENIFLVLYENSTLELNQKPQWNEDPS